MILVLGSTGTIGGYVTKALARHGHQVRTASRRKSAGTVRFDWYDPATHEKALAGVRAVHVLPPLGEIDPAPIMLPFLRRARQAGVHRVVLLSSSAIPAGEHGLGLVHTRLAEEFDEWAVLRPSWFMSNFVGDAPHAISAREHSEIVSATGDGRVAFVDPADIAEVAAHALTDPAPHNTDHVITGPEALSYADVAMVLSEVAGRPVRHRAVGEAEISERFVAAGLPPAFARLLAGMDVAIAAGAEDRTTTTVTRVTGRAPRTFRSFCGEWYGSSVRR